MRTPPPLAPARSIQIDFHPTATQTQVALTLLPPPRYRQPNHGVPRLSLRRALAPAPVLPNQRLVEKLASAPIFREFRQAFETATGLPLTLRGVTGWQLAHQRHQPRPGFCALLYQTNRSRAACLEMQQRVCVGVNGVPCTLNYSFGITETAVSVKVGAEIIAYLQTGQVLFRSPTPQQKRQVLQLIQDWELEVDPKVAARYYRETRVMRRTTYRACVRLLQVFADQLGATANQIVLQHRTAEPAPITRARHFIDEHYQDDLTLAAVAGEVRMSTFYFCKKFKQVTGLSFTQYVSRIRVEQAKSLLLNLNYRVSETAFEVGCQSLSHFNRIFKNIAGTSPTEFRRRQPGA